MSAGFRIVRELARPIVVGIALAACLNAAPVQSGRLAEIPGQSDPSLQLRPEQREAALALGAASRHVEASRFAEARAALAGAKAVPALRGYAEWVRVRLLMKEGSAEEAYRVATATLAEPISDALRAAFGVLQGEALAMSGDTGGAERAWQSLLADPPGQDLAVRQSIELAIVAARQRTGSLDPAVDPRVLLDETFAETPVTSLLPPTRPKTPEELLSEAQTKLDSGHTARAVGLFDEAIAGGLTGEQRHAAQLGRAHALFRTRRYEAAERAFKALLPNPEARFWRARSLARLDRIEDSIAEFEAVARESAKQWASWALYLVGTLYEGREEMPAAIAAFERAARFEEFPDRRRSALWRQGWAEYRIADFAAARRTFEVLVAEVDDPLDALRPRYWAARAAIQSGKQARGRAALETIARDFPLTYYGWRAQERLEWADASLVRRGRKLARGTQRVEDVAIERAALLIEAGLEDLARNELRFSATRAIGFDDRTRVGLLLAKVGDYHRASGLVVSAYSDSLARGLQPGREALWWLSWPPAYRELIEEVFPRDAKIDRELVWAIMREESHYQVEARSAVGALGLLQLMPETAAQLARERGIDDFQPEQLFDPRINILLGSAYLAQLGDRFDGRLSAAIGSYNAGPHKVAAWLQGADADLEDDVWVEKIPYDQTRSYVKRVLRSLHAYKRFYR